MAVVAGLMAVSSDNTAEILWGGLGDTNSDEGDPMEASRYPEKTVQVTGTFGTGGELTMQGSNDDVNYFTLTDDFGNDLTFSAADVKNVRQNPRYIKPKCTGGDTTTLLNVHIKAV